MKSRGVCVMVLVSLLAGTKSTKPAWPKQLGTIQHPRMPGLSPVVREGSIYLIHNRYFRSKIDGDFNAMIWKYGLPPQGSTENEAWQEINKGSFLYPKRATEDYEYLAGDIYSSQDGGYYKAMTDGQTSDFGNLKESPILEPLDVKAGWMGLLRNEIGNQRLGDIMTPGTHDTGTVGIDENSYLVEQESLLQFAQDFDPQILTNWSRTQKGSLGEQCRAGFRSFDLRIADMEEQDGSFRWWHGTTGFEIQRELQEVVEFLEENPNEILRMYFNNFKKPGNSDSPTVSIPNYRKDMISNILLEYLGPHLAPRSQLSSNPTMNEVLATGKNIILEMQDTYIRSKHDGFWPVVTTYAWTGKTNPEDLFVERSSTLEGYKQNSAGRMTKVSGCNTPDQKMVIGALLRVYGDDETIRIIVGIIWPELLDIDLDRMGFEGMWTDLLSLTEQGTNTRGMQVRSSSSYTSGASIHYSSGVNFWAYYWLARPQKYKLNEVHVDDAVDSSTLVDTAILSARGEIPREVTIAFQGNAKDGYYRWDDSDLQTEGGRDGLQCTTPSEARYRVTSDSFTIDEEWQNLANKDVVTFQEGEYPGDAVFELQVSGPGFSDWFDIHNDIIQSMIENNLDLYLRGTNKEDGSGGFAYTSYTYNVFGEACDTPPVSGFIELVEW